MPNYCNYIMKVKGDTFAIRTFYDWLNANYDYSKENVSDQPFHFFRIFEADIVEECKYELTISGDCAWSVETCMLEHGYYFDFKERYPDKFKGITLPIACEKLKVECEVYSTEPGMEFAEHIYVNEKGDILIDRTVDYEEKYDDNEEFIGVECEYNFDDLDWEIDK